MLGLTECVVMNQCYLVRRPTHHKVTEKTGMCQVIRDDEDDVRLFVPTLMATTELSASYQLLLKDGYEASAPSALPLRRLATGTPVSSPLRALWPGLSVSTFTRSLSFSYRG